MQLPLPLLPLALATGAVTAAAAAAATSERVATAVPGDWAQGVRRGDLLFSPIDNAVIIANATTVTASEARRGGAVVGNASSWASLSEPLLPVLSNGFLGWAVDSADMYVAGVFNGAGPNSHRARLPATVAVAIEGPEGSEEAFLGAVLDVRGASFSRRRQFRLQQPDNTASGPTVTVEQRWYAHHAFRGLLVMELHLRSSPDFDPDATTPLVELTLRDTAATAFALQDLIFEDLSPQHPGLRVLRGRTMLPEDMDAINGTTVEVDVVSTELPPTVRVMGGNQSWHFLTAVRTSAGDPGLVYGDPLEGALQDHRLASLMAPSGELLKLHQDRWKDGIWSGAGIELTPTASSSPPPADDDDGLAFLPAATNASLLALYSALREDWPYGLAPGGITQGGRGHSRWDTEIYVLPALLPFHPSLAQRLLQYRLDRLPAAREKARGFDPAYAGAMFPWESAATGMEVASTGKDGVDYGAHAVHVSGAVAWAAWQVWLATNDLDWLATSGYPLLREVATFWASRVESAEDSRSNSSSPVHIRGVVPPDGFAAAASSPSGGGKTTTVDDSVYTNGIAALSLRHAARAARVLVARGRPEADEEATIAAWEALVGRIVILPPAAGETSGAHPEYDGYAGQPVQQADAVLLGHPLGFYDAGLVSSERARGADDAWAADLAYYAGKYDRERGLGAMTWSMQTTGLLSTGQAAAAAEAFPRAFTPYCQPPFGVWTERSVEEEGGVASGMANFLPAAGGLIQTLLYGYAGVKVVEDTGATGPHLGSSLMRLAPEACPPSTRVVRIRHLAFLGNHLAFNYTCGEEGGGGGIGAAEATAMTLAAGRAEPGAPALQLVVPRGVQGKEKEEQRFALLPGTVVSLPAQTAWLARAPSEGGEGDRAMAAAEATVAASARLYGG